MNKRWWFATGGGILLPANIIIGLQDSVSVPTDWTLYTDADGYYLKGSDLDEDMGQTDTTSGISYTSGWGGSHSNAGNAVLAHNHGNQPYTGNRGEFRRDTASGKMHHQHSVSGSYTPPKNRLRLMQADVETPIPTNGIMFSKGAVDSEHTALSLFNNNDGYLFADSNNTDTVAQSGSLTVNSYNPGIHYHYWETSDVTVDGVGSDATNYWAYGSFSHNHTGVQNNPAFTPQLQEALVRAWLLSDAGSVDGLIGMWVDQGVPDGWVIDSDLTDNYIRNDAGGSGNNSGDNTIDISDTSDSWSHSHSATGSSGYVGIGWFYHTNSVSHVHSLSTSRSFEPARFKLKFIRHVG